MNLAASLVHVQDVCGLEHEFGKNIGDSMAGGTCLVIIGVHRILRLPALVTQCLNALVYFLSLS